MKVIVNELIIDRKTVACFEKINSNHPKMHLVGIYLTIDSGYVSLCQQSIKNDIKNNKFFDFIFNATEINVNNDKLTLKYRPSEKTLTNTELIFSEKELFKLTRKYWRVIKENNWKKIIVTFDGKIFDISSENFTEEELKTMKRKE